jgi:fimbrial chaperone protein
MYKAVLIAASIACASFAARAAEAPAVSMDVAPTTLELKPGTVDVFYVANHGAAPVTVALDCFDWTQGGDADRLTPSQGLIASPPVATIAPNARQLVRVLAASTGAPTEGTYRLFVSQLADDAPRDGNAVRILLRFGVPVFAGSGAERPELTWDARQHGDTLDLAVRNDGTHAVKLSSPHVTERAAALTPAADTFIYVLPGATRHFGFRGASPGAQLHVAARDLRSENDVTADLIAHP